MAHMLGGKVERGEKREFGKGTLTIKDAASPLFAGLPETLHVWNSHGDKLTKMPPGFQSVGVSDNSEFAAIEDRKRKFFGLQFHPEVAHTPRGKDLISHFVHGVCGCGKGWNMRRYIAQAVEDIQKQVGNERVILGLSGGVDSSVAAALIHKAIGSQLTCIFVNNGLLRGREADTVREVFGRHFKVKLQYEDASTLFLRKLKGVADPERKRKIIGQTFIKVFEAGDKAREAPRSFSRRARCIPTSSSPSRSAAIRLALIKSHHNVGGLPKKMKFQLVEPLKCLFKDEVRVARLGLEFAQGDRHAAAVPGTGPRRAHPRAGDPAAMRDFAQSRHHCGRGNESGRLVL